jgi:hypothetical protein
VIRCTWLFTEFVVLGTALGACTSAPAGQGSTTHLPSTSTSTRTAATASLATPPSCQGCTPPPVPPGIHPLSVTRLGRGQTWVLAAVPCAGGSCIRIEHSVDGDRSWSPVGAPPAPVAGASGDILVDRQRHAVSRLRFGDTNNAWAFDPGLWTTHDGGAHWTMPPLPQATNSSGVMALETDGRYAYAFVPSFALHAAAMAHARCTSLISEEVGSAGPVAENRAAMRTRRAMTNMSAVAGVVLVRYQGARRRRSATTSSACSEPAYQRVSRL